MAVTREGRSRDRTNANIVSRYGKFCQTLQALKYHSPALEKCITIDHFTVSCLVAGPLNESEAGGDFVLLETSLLFSC